MNKPKPDPAFVQRIKAWDEYSKLKPHPRALGIAAARKAKNSSRNCALVPDAAVSPGYSRPHEHETNRRQD